MPIRVVSFCIYPTHRCNWRPADHDAHKFIDAIKDRPINGFAYIPVPDNWCSFDDNTRHRVVGWFADMVAEYFKTDPILHHPATLVPVPNSCADVNFRCPTRTAVLANAIANRLGAGWRCRDVLRWRKLLPAANENGGTRDPAGLYRNLAFVESLDFDRAILVDDVVSSGGHLRACSAKLRVEGCEVEWAFCAGRADDMIAPKPFATRVDTIPDYIPLRRPIRRLRRTTLPPEPVGGPQAPIDIIQSVVQTRLQH